jgi:acetoin utilization protein AcuC
MCRPTPDAPLGHNLNVNSILVYSPALAAYDLGPDHPLRPERYTLAVELMEAYGLVPDGTAEGRAEGARPVDTPAALGVIPPAPATDDDLLRVHTPELVAAVRSAGRGERLSWATAARHGIGTMDTPAFPKMHEAAALVAGATSIAVDEVLSGRAGRALNVAGGLHHAHRDRVAGFCVYNDAAVAIARALRDAPDLRVLYVDIDAHHGDGVQAIFFEEPRVLTVSLHETGLALYPGTGFVSERGDGAGRGFAANVPLPPLATDACYRAAFDEAVAPLSRRFGPDLIVAQCGADAHHADPLTDLGLTLAGHRWLVRSIVALADELCCGRLVALGGGGYGWEHVVPRAWAALAAELAGVDLPDELPEAWRAHVRAVAHVEPPSTLREDRFDVGPPAEARLLAETRDAVEALMRDV